MTKQEMFDRAVIGLRRQGWQKSVFGEGTSRCVYDDGKGKKCAWGHVDPDLTAADVGDVYDLRRAKRGVASTLNNIDIVFAREMQLAHDSRADGMESRFRRVSANHNLTFPEAS